MRQIIDFFKGAFGLFAIVFVGLLAVLFFFVFNSAYAIAIAIVGIITILVLPYYFGRQNQPEKKGNYKLRKVK
jgi:hypothetical protein